MPLEPPPPPEKPRYCCAACGHRVERRSVTFRLDTLTVTVPVMVCTHLPCLVKQGATTYPTKALASA